MNIGDPDTPRWVQPFQHFDGALVLLREGVELLDDPDVHPIVREGVIRRFEYTFELAWKTLKGYLIWRKVTLERQAAADVIRTAFATGYIEEGPIWFDALDARNEMSHVYRQLAFERVVHDVRARFIERFEALHEMLISELVRLHHG